MRYATTLLSDPCQPIPWRRRRNPGSRRAASSGPLIIAVIVLLALAVAGWFLLGSRNRAAEEAAVKSLREAGALVTLNDQHRAFSANLSTIRDEVKMDEAVAALADMPEISIVDVSRSPFNDEHAKMLSQLTSLTSLMLNNTKITDAAMSEISELDGLTSLGVANTAITGEGIKNVQGMDELNILDISGTKVSGGLEALTNLSKLNWVNMRRLKITDESMMSLADSDSIGKITIDPGTVSDETLAALKEKDSKLIIDIPNFGSDSSPAANSGDAAQGDAVDDPDKSEGNNASSGDSDTDALNSDEAE